MEPMYSETEEVKQRRQDKDAPKTDEGVINQDNGRRGRKGERHLVQGSGPLYRRENRKDTQASNATSIDNALLTAFLVLLMRQL